MALFPQVIQTRINGVLTLIKGALTSTGSANAGQIPVLGPNGTLDMSLLPNIAPGAQVSALATAAISAGAICHFFINGSGLLSVKPADATAAGSEGNCFAPSAIASGATGLIQFSGSNPNFSNLTDGFYYLGAAGAITNTVPNTSGAVFQIVGRPNSAGALQVRFEEASVLA